MKTSKNNHDEQTVVDKGGNARIEVNINANGNNEPKKKRGFKRGAVVGTLGGIFLGGAGAAYAIENDITMNDIEDGVNDIIDDIERGYNAAVNGDEPAAEEPVVEPVVEPAAEEPVVEPAAEEPADQNLTHEDVLGAINDAVNGEEQSAEVAEDDTLTHEDVLGAINEAVNGEEPAEVAADDTELVVSETNFDDMSFDDAFAAARAEVGPGNAFEWRGGLYGTFLADEWNEMSDDEKSEYGAKVSDVLDDYEFGHEDDEVVVEPLDEPSGDTEVVVVEDPSDEPEVVVVDEPIDDVNGGIEVEVVNTWNITDASGDQVNMAHMTVDGQDVALIDQDGDGVMDVMVFDENQDGVIDDSDVFDIQDQGLMAEDINGLMDSPVDEPMDDMIDSGADFMA